MVILKTDPKSIKAVTLTGIGLTIEQVVAVARYNAEVIISDEAIEKMTASRKMAEEIIDNDITTYGINTGFGEFSKISISHEDIEKLQTNLILSHCCAVGQPYPDEVVRAMMILRANALCIGFSGIRPCVVIKLAEMLNKGVIPVVPEKGSLGASGDLAPLAHMVLPMLGYGEAHYNGETLPGSEAMKKAGISVVKLHAKEGLALINGTQAMTAVGLLSYYDASIAIKTADIAGALTLEALNGLINAFDPRVAQVRPHNGQMLTAKNIRLLTADSEILRKSKDLRVQDAYALRCMPQIHGAIRDALDYVKKALDTEINSVTDNPILFRDDGSVISGGNFHGEPMAIAFDLLGIASAEIADISERRLERLVNPALSCGLPAFLTKHGGLNSGYMICQYSAASMVSENKIYAHPASVDSIPSSANQEDHVSMGTTAARKSRLIVENTLSVLAFELMAAAQGIDLRESAAQSPVLKTVHDHIRSIVPTLEEDREIRIDIKRMNELVRSRELISLVTSMLPEFE